MTLTASAPPDDPARPAVLIVEADASFRAALQEANHGHDAFEALGQVLVSRGYEVVVAFSREEAQRLLKERSFEKVFSDGTLSEDGPSGADKAPIFHMQGLSDGNVRVRIDHAVPPPVALALLDVLVDNAPDELPTYS